MKKKAPLWSQGSILDSMSLLVSLCYVRFPFGSFGQLHLWFTFIYLFFISSTTGAFLIGWISRDRKKKRKDYRYSARETGNGTKFIQWRIWIRFLTGRKNQLFLFCTRFPEAKVTELTTSEWGLRVYIGYKDWLEKIDWFSAEVLSSCNNFRINVCNFSLPLWRDKVMK